MKLHTIIGSAVAAAGLLVASDSPFTLAGSGTHHSHHSNHQLSARLQRHPHTDGLGGVRASTAQFHSIATAEQRGHTLLTDVNGVACIDMPGKGGMGVHWARVGNPTIQARHPEALVYAPDRHGTLRLAAVEYVVTKEAWEATHAQAPKLFGHRFDLTSAPNRFGLPAFYSLHAWAWKHNPAGKFSMWNPHVVC